MKMNELLSDGNSSSLIHKDTARVVLKESITVFVFGELMVLLFHEVFYFKHLLNSFFLLVAFYV